MQTKDKGFIIAGKTNSGTPGDNMYVIKLGPEITTHTVKTKIKSNGKGLSKIKTILIDSERDKHKNPTNGNGYVDFTEIPDGKAKIKFKRIILPPNNRDYFLGPYCKKYSISGWLGVDDKSIVGATVVLKKNRYTVQKTKTGSNGRYKFNPNLREFSIYIIY